MEFTLHQDQMKIEDLRLYHRYRLASEEYELVRMGSPCLRSQESGLDWPVDGLPEPIQQWGVAVLENNYEAELVVPLAAFAQWAEPV